MQISLLHRRILVAVVTTFLMPPLLAQSPSADTLRVGVAAVAITPYGPNPDWHGNILPNGVWGEKFNDSNHNGRWDPGETFEDDPANSTLSGNSRSKYDGIYIAGFDNNRMASGKHDDLWARALVLGYGSSRIAIVALDLIGYYSHGGYYGLDEVRKKLDPGLAIGEILISSTHNHEAPDTIGLWGANPLNDGKYPMYLQFVDQQIAKAITRAAKSITPARMKLGRTDPQLSPALRGMQTRTAGRPPQFFDEELRVMQFESTVGQTRGKTIATLINWNTHPESMEDENTLLTSDFPGALREAIEKKYGGTAVYVSGDLGAVEIVGDNDLGVRTTFDGKTFPVVAGNKQATFTFARTEAIGREVAQAVFDALQRGEWSAVTGIVVKKAELRALMDNAGYSFLSQQGVLSTLPAAENGRLEITTPVYVVSFGNGQILTAPGELFPEVFYGVEEHRRRDCPAADTHRPPEPAVREHMTAKYKFIFGLSLEEFGYIVPEYDFLRPAFAPQTGFTEAKDPCKQTGIPDHYHETNSASSEMAPAWACTAVKLLTGAMSKSLACRDITALFERPQL